jgi:hypothetical protein
VTRLGAAATGVIAVLAILAHADSLTAQGAIPGPPPGWTRNFTDGFDVPSGFPKPGWTATYPASWRDTSRFGHYAACPDSCSVSGGLLHLHLHGDDVAAPVPDLPVLTEGRYTVRFQIPAATANYYKIAFLLWPDDPQGGVTAKDGEIDFPETNTLPGTISAFTHWTNPSANSDQQAFHTQASTSDWHTATIERRAQSVKYILDGQQIGESTGPRLPTKPFHWVLQSETRLESSASPPASAFADILIDWVTVDVIGNQAQDNPNPEPAPPPAPKPAPRDATPDYTHFHCVL